MSPAAENLHATAAPPAVPGSLTVRVAGHYREGPAYRVRRPHGTDDWLLTYTAGGAGLYGAGGGDGRRAVPGDLWLTPPGVPHDYGTDPDAGAWEFWWAHFLPRPGWEAWLAWAPGGAASAARRLGTREIRARMRRAWERLLSDARAVGPPGPELAANALEEVLLLSARADPGPVEAGAARDPRVAEVLDFLAAHLGEPLGLPAAAARVSLSPSRLAHLLRAATGRSFGATLRALRLREAARLLRFTDRPVADIAAEVGFGSPFYFTRRFTAAYGLSPRAYRRAAGRQA
jgi:AraC family transcriptional regulator of arabinose operon